ncbi:MAG: hypothetical protein F6K48_01095 [Okeania sp. SIO3H1]|uniref:hypothetical protein n=1 Tax=Okeania sp. SIO1I7 TaxID=2607772 RepID=UPI0013CAC93B|nr:hypothetical protein [Okeania sp. SIO1I7]NEN87593.1 hypothetical protein [Okeania sp. SIO3H1]NET24000.1 hypothetical protein [Okeania sp. SIO1I7]
MQENRLHKKAIAAPTKGDRFMRQTRRTIAQNLKKKRLLCLLLEKVTERSFFLKIGNRDFG